MKISFKNFGLLQALVLLSLIYVIASLTNAGEALLIIGNLNDKIKPEYYFMLNVLMICGRYEFIGYFLILIEFLNYVN